MAEKKFELMSKNWKITPKTGMANCFCLFVGLGKKFSEAERNIEILKYVKQNAYLGSSTLINSKKSSTEIDLG